MDTRQEGAIDFPNHAHVDESAVALKESKSQATGTTSSKPKKRNTKHTKRAAAKTSGQEKLTCRYCGSDDLAPSFKKRRDARCRACFKKRYAPGVAKRAKPTRAAKAGK